MKFIIAFLITFLIENQGFSCDEFGLCDQPDCKVRMCIDSELKVAFEALGNSIHQRLWAKSTFSYYDLCYQFNKIEDFKSPDWKFIHLDSECSKIKKVPIQFNPLSFFIKKIKEKNSDVAIEPVNLEEYGISCGPISIAMAYELMGYSKEDWPKFIKSFPYFFGGVFPHRLVSHLDREKQGQEPSLTHVRADDFKVILDTVRKEIDQNRPAIVLLVNGIRSQHYVNILGYDDRNQKVLILDPSGQLQVVTDHWLEQIMYAGVRRDQGIRYFLGSLVMAPYMMMRTHVGYYNAFTFNGASLEERKAWEQKWEEEREQEAVGSLSPGVHSAEYRGRWSTAWEKREGTSTLILRALGIRRFSLFIR